MYAELFNKIVEFSPYANFVYNLDTKEITYSNQAFQTLTGVYAQEPTCASLLSLIDNEDQEYLDTCFKRLKEGETQQVIEFRLHKQNEVIWIRLTPLLFTTESGSSILCYMTDITAEVRSLHTMKKYANKKNSVLNILSHDLRGPLGIANTVTQVLKKEIKDPQLINLTETISKILKQTIDLINDLTGREFLETTDVELVKARVNIALKLKEYIEECQHSEEITQRTFRFSSNSEKIFMSVDESKFMQVINNLMTNALKFTQDNGTISLDIKEQADVVLFTFSDDGIGIPKQFHSTLFKKFSDARRPGLHGEPTVGLGLSIVKTIIEWHKGKIWFESNEGEGATFYVKIPKT